MQPKTVLESLCKTFKIIRCPDEAEGSWDGEAGVGHFESAQRLLDPSCNSGHSGSRRETHLVIAESAARAKHGDHGIHGLDSIAVLWKRMPQNSHGGVHARQRFVVSHPRVGEIA